MEKKLEAMENIISHLSETKVYETVESIENEKRGKPIPSFDKTGKTSPYPIGYTSTSNDMTKSNGWNCSIM